MIINEIRINAVYKALVNVQFRGPRDDNDTYLFVFVIGKTSGGLVEAQILHSPTNEVFLLDPAQIFPV